MEPEKYIIPEGSCPKCGKITGEVTTGTSTGNPFCKCKKEKPKLDNFICPVCGHGKSPITGYCNCNNHWS